jgi:hypothetical protein
MRLPVIVGTAALVIISFAQARDALAGCTPKDGVGRGYIDPSSPEAQAEELAKATAPKAPETGAEATCESSPFGPRPLTIFDLPPAREFERLDSGGYRVHPRKH